MCVCVYVCVCVCVNKWICRMDVEYGALGIGRSICKVLEVRVYCARIMQGESSKKWKEVLYY